MHDHIGGPALDSDKMTDIESRLHSDIPHMHKHVPRII